MSLTTLNTGSRAEHIDLLVNSLSDFAVVIMDPDGYFTTWHPGMKTIFDYGSEAVIGRHVSMLFTPGDRLLGAPSRELETARRTGSANDTRWLFRRNGVNVPVEGVTIRLNTADGNFVGFGKVMRDVSQQQTGQQQRRALMGALNQSSIIIRDREGVIYHWTRGCERLYGFSASEALGQVCHRLLHTSYVGLSRHEVTRRLERDRFWAGEVEQTTKTGERLVIASEQIVTLHSAFEGTARVIETQTDVTERSAFNRKLEAMNQQLKRLATELERSNQELSEFARIASHDLSAPLVSAGWLVDVLALKHGAGMSDTAKDMLRQVRGSLNRMSELTEGILAHARAGMTAVRSNTSTDSERALSSAIQDLSKMILASGAQIDHMPLPAVYVAEHALTQLFQNLISNAIKYAAPGRSPVISVWSREEAEFQVFSIRDNGRGIPADWQERIFQTMQRFAEVGVAGSGIGLATCRKIVERVGGRIWVEKSGEDGSTFCFTLPREVVQDNIQTDRPVSVESPS